MDFTVITRILALAGLVICTAGILLRLKSIVTRPFRHDLSSPNGSAGRGILYAFTLGMAPWEKESTRLHWIAYIRGIIFHLGIFTSIAILLLSFWPANLTRLPEPVRWFAVLLAGAGGLLGFAGIPMRLMEANTRALSLPDDYFSVFMTALFEIAASLLLLVPSTLPVFYLVSGLLMAYIPASKIRHCVYFFYAKFFFGYGFGRRGVIGKPHHQTAE
jgi:hypothetical protein